MLSERITIFSGSYVLSPSDEFQEAPSAESRSHSDEWDKTMFPHTSDQMESQISMQTVAIEAYIFLSYEYENTLPLS